MRPYVYLMAAVTIDGRIASKSGYSRLSCPHDLKRLHALRAEVDAVIVGANTAIIDNPRLTVRYAAGRNPTRVLIDGALRAPTTLRIFDKTAPTIVYTTNLAPAEKINELRRLGIEVVVFPSHRVDPASVLSDLYNRGVRKVLIEGGGRTNWEFISKCLVDEVIVTVTPYVFGSGVSLVEGEGFKDIEEMPFNLKLLGVKLCECGKEVVVKYAVECKKVDTKYNRLEN
ncbi:2,5-diamino-6-(ribosylamino)-4(3H)-pyrimidinone 5'-phosphate reductase [Pyrobaculum aerophilum]|uniref:2,5-diamino-6-(ribosylamino)-4(3H)-pyrimidinone 5'-phosphate reductase n=2 Tax=Pyrobaculum aerophilum TaxID=13773 RepID=Q8ZU19_PYRAE|nr:MULTISPECIES: 2,5-diamino-6-(ribosylamino)-4(3H)-pyrimidinone 5'-phosphate reductase [Pyrobaculum]AAL64589.1 riboflavin specific deaminase, putative [Pyrobaculum aerophilum str. IM2]RFA96689.1 2,5-diamino-6-(ribosylamino)-4(3H)-pyrimidinone 5'-phosphate reductase [Pyrobaculum aerophilum]RFB00319.1 2,5-diamino-6-(ribosylamino)-4(3H)-pyrimidinone 5'-phosphate reductase [Pyrobaculum aerophilum]HII47433.1 2,5-diamino-6-(ribosylamino)-4(3H)-pyrimidinone 5'-phosphate reductase [Pyrobaculum aerophi